MAGPQGNPMVLRKRYPACLLGIWDVPSLSPRLALFLAAPPLPTGPAPLVGSPLASLGHQGSLCVHPATTPGWQLMARRHMQKAPCSELDIQPPRLAAP